MCGDVYGGDEVGYCNFGLYYLLVGIGYFVVDVYCVDEVWVLVVGECWLFGCCVGWEW